MSEHNIIKPIETVYKGYRFRSRLEARWAVFFDTLMWEWEYEPEGYQLPNGLRYLPDFRLICAHGSIYIEIKPLPVDMSCLPKPLEFYLQIHPLESCDLVLAFGTPDKEKTFSWVCDGHDIQYGPCLLTTCPFCESDAIKHPSIFFFHQPILKPLEIAARREATKLIQRRNEMAYHAALSARFEFGEDGTR